MNGVYQLKNNLEEDGLDIFYSTCSIYVLSLIDAISLTYSLCFEGFFNNKKKLIKLAVVGAGDAYKKYRQIKKNELEVVEWLNINLPEVGRLYIQLTGSMNEAANSLNEMTVSFANHFYNSHKPFNKEQVKEINLFEVLFSKYLYKGIGKMEQEKENTLDDFIDLYNRLLVSVKKMNRNHVYRISNDEVSQRNSALFFKFLKEVEKLISEIYKMVNLSLEMQSLSFSGASYNAMLMD
ncbi:MAG: hypothetical protein JW798_16270 [Prolixibacteraceae bacterium]|nr:hypothetical protein [Prolixibacteraceae bacterium]